MKSFTGEELSEEYRPYTHKCSISYLDHLLGNKGVPICGAEIILNGRKCRILSIMSLPMVRLSYDFLIEVKNIDD